MHMKITQFNLEKFKIAKGIIKKFKMKYHKLDPDTSDLTKHQILQVHVKMSCQTKGCAREINHRFGTYLGYGRNIVDITE